MEWIVCAYIERARAIKKIRNSSLHLLNPSYIMDVYFGLKPKLSTQRFKSTKEWKKGLLVKVWNFKQAAQLVPSSKKKTLVPSSSCHLKPVPTPLTLIDLHTPLPLRCHVFLFKWLLENIDYWTVGICIINKKTVIFLEWILMKFIYYPFIYFYNKAFFN